VHTPLDIHRPHRQEIESTIQLIDIQMDLFPQPGDVGQPARGASENVMGTVRQIRARNFMSHADLRLIVPNTENGTVSHPPRRRPNATVRAREYLTLAEVDRLIEARTS
jgi:hypothetical protein